MRPEQICCYLLHVLGYDGYHLRQIAEWLEAGK
jgi:hypothetical protein